MASVHVPVLLKEVLEFLNPMPNENFIDACFGEGGHSAAILQRNKPSGKVLGIEIDPDLTAGFSIFNTPGPRQAAGDSPKGYLSNRLVLVNDSYINLKKIVEKHNFRPINGILFDLGMSTWHLEKSGRGFSFQKNEPLDMRYNITSFQLSLKRCYQGTAADIVNHWSEEEIIKILREYGQERFAKRIAKKIIEQRKLKPIKTTFQLTAIIKKAVPGWYQRQRIHPATRTFQALRIAVNNELENLEKALFQALEILEPGARIVAISFHSGEDRIVKNFFRDQGKKKTLEILTKKPIIPTKKEIEINPCSRSAKLRVAIKPAGLAE